MLIWPVSHLDRKALKLPCLHLGDHTAGQPASSPLIVSGHLMAVGKGSEALARLYVLVEVSLSLLPRAVAPPKPASA